MSSSSSSSSSSSTTIPNVVDGTFRLIKKLTTDQERAFESWLQKSLVQATSNSGNVSYLDVKHASDVQAKRIRLTQAVSNTDPRCLLEVVAVTAGQTINFDDLRQDRSLPCVFVVWMEINDTTQYSYTDKSAVKYVEATVAKGNKEFRKAVGEVVYNAFLLQAYRKFTCSLKSLIADSGISLDQFVNEAIDEQAGIEVISSNVMQKPKYHVMTNPNDVQNALTKVSRQQTSNTLNVFAFPVAEQNPARSIAFNEKDYIPVIKEAVDRLSKGLNLISQHNIVLAFAHPVYNVFLKQLSSTENAAVRTQLVARSIQLEMDYTSDDFDVTNSNNNNNNINFITRSIERHLSVHNSKVSTFEAISPNMKASVTQKLLTEQTSLSSDMAALINKLIMLKVVNMKSSRSNQ